MVRLWNSILLVEGMVFAGGCVEPEVNILVGSFVRGIDLFGMDSCSEWRWPSVRLLWY
jgi:hypothetical protein